MDKFLTYLRYCFYNDASMMWFQMGSNHNAMDRCCCGENAVIHSVLPDFEERFTKAEANYLNRRKFPEGYEPFMDEYEEKHYDALAHEDWPKRMAELDEYVEWCMSLWKDRFFELRNDENWFKPIIEAHEKRKKVECDLFAPTPYQLPDTVEEDRILI